MIAVLGSELSTLGHPMADFAYSLFRVAAISQGIMRRALDGSASSPHALEAGRKARVVADAAWQRVADIGQTPN